MVGGFTFRDVWLASKVAYLDIYLFYVYVTFAFRFAWRTIVSATFKYDEPFVNVYHYFWTFNPPVEGTSEDAGSLGMTDLAGSVSVRDSSCCCVFIRHAWTHMARRDLDKLVTLQRTQSQLPTPNVSHTHTGTPNHCIHLSSSETQVPRSSLYWTVSFEIRYQRRIILITDR